MVELKVKFAADAEHLRGKTLQYKSAGASGMDLCACLRLKDKKIFDQFVKIPSKTYILVPTGISVEIPAGYEGHVRSRSGISTRDGLCVHGGLGTIDSDYRGEIHIPIINCSRFPRLIREGERIAQLVICPVVQVKIIPVKKLALSDRGVYGLGSTGRGL